jgi:hypothetical protein
MVVVVLLTQPVAVVVLEQLELMPQLVLQVVAVMVRQLTQVGVWLLAQVKI